MVPVELSTVLAALFVESGDDVFIATSLVLSVMNIVVDVTV